MQWDRMMTIAEIQWSPVPGDEELRTQDTSRGFPWQRCLSYGY
jgi:hypothetical protein